jgi:hypothetical protein
MLARDLIELQKLYQGDHEETVKESGNYVVKYDAARIKFKKCALVAGIELILFCL